MTDWSQYKAAPSSEKTDWSQYKVTQEPQEAKGWEGVLRGVLEGGKQTPEALAGLMQIPGQAFEALTELPKHPTRSKLEALSGVLQGMKGIVNTPTILQNYLKSKGLYTPLPWEEKGESALPIPQDTGLQKLVLGANRPGDEFVQGLGKFVPYIAGGEAAGIGPITQMGAQAIGENQNPIPAMLAGRVLEAAPKIISKGTDSLRPSVMFRGNLPPEELQANVRATEGTNTPLGRVLKEPKLSKLFENVTSQMPMSGGSDALNNIKKQVGEKAESTLQSIAPPNVSGDLNDLTQSLLKSAGKSQEKLKNNLYEKRNAIAQQEGHQLELPTFEKKAKNVSKTLEDSPLYMNDPAFKSAFNKLRGYQETTKKVPGEFSLLDQYGKPMTFEGDRIIRPSLTEAQMTANKLRRLGDEMKSSPDSDKRYIGGLYKDLAGSLRNDIKTSIKEKGSPELQAAQLEADKNYKENFSPFLEKNIYKWTGENFDPQKIVRDIIKPGAKSDQYRTIEKVNKLLPEDQKNLLGYSYLKGAEDKLGNIDPKQLAALIKSLGNRQFKALFPDPSVRQKLTDYGNFRGMNEEALNVLHNPKTGFKLLGMAQLMSFLAHPVASLSPSALSYAGNKIMTSPVIRKKLIDKMIENSKKTQSTLPKKNAKMSLSQALLGSKISQQQKNDE